ncbi:MAG: glutathione S-transferase [Cyanobacteria bacterium P01_A01_bin.84]
MNKYSRTALITFSSIAVILLFSNCWNLSTVALPPTSDIPEEVLRSQIITAARSPIDGKPLTPGEYAQLEAQLQKRSTPPKLSSRVRRTVYLLRLRKLIKSVFPFIDI